MQCVQCKRDSWPDAKFCSECGTPFSPQAAAVQPQLFNASDSWHDGFVGKHVTYKTRKGLEDKTSLELIRSGQRTAYSSNAPFFNKVRVGDLFRLTRKTDNVTVRIITLPYPTSSVSAEQWSALEGLDSSLYTDYFGQIGYFQFQFELVNPDPVDGSWNPVNLAKTQKGKKDALLASRTKGSLPRRFRLPDKTTPEQDFALDLPETEFYLLLGGPGTGKSVIALLRARRLAKKGHTHKFLAFNKLLVHASRNLDANTANNQNMAIRADTWISWFRATWTSIVGTQCPYHEHVYEIDWQKVRLQLAERFPVGVDIPTPKESFLVIDEGQDMPKDFYEILVELGYENIFVVADFNQILHRGLNSNYPDLCNALLKTASLRFSASATSKEQFTQEHVVQLTYNHRNSYPVAQLARSFYAESPQNVPPDLPPPRRTDKIPELVTYAGTPDFLKIVRRILVTADSDPTKLIGVLCPNNDVRQSYADAFLQSNVQLSNGMPRIESYSKTEGVLPDFAVGGIILLNAQACKGLEFDYVIIADIDKFQYWGAIDSAQKMLFYVMVSRAIERVIMTQNSANPCPISAILPTDQNILRQ